jgi:hypothetical protein
MLMHGGCGRPLSLGWTQALKFSWARSKLTVWFVEDVTIFAIC